MELKVKEKYHQLKFKCKQCGYCCDHTYIQLYPFDIWNICNQLNLKTIEFNQKYSLIKSIENIPRCFLKNQPKCPFKELQKQSCTIYNVRPMRCRLYPIGKFYQEDGTVYILSPEKCTGFDTGKKQTIERWIEQQGADKFEWLAEKWNNYLIKLKDNPRLVEKTVQVIFKKVFYDFDDDYIKNQRSKLRPEKDAGLFMDNLMEIFEMLVEKSKNPELNKEKTYY